MTLSRLRGNEPRLASITGRLSIPGAQVQVLDSRSGWATFADNEGYFTLPDVIWFPFAKYDLVESADGEKGKIIRVTAPERLPENGIFKVEITEGEPIDLVDLKDLPGNRSISLVDYDSQNAPYYRDLFVALTAGKESEEEQVNAVNDFVSSKLDYDQKESDLISPRRVLEQGSQYCGHLSTALATLLATGGYKTRMIDLRDAKTQPNTHVVVEVFYGGEWHLYDPTFGLQLRNQDGNVASYEDVRLNASAITEALFKRFGPTKSREIAAMLPKIMSTGFHHFYYFKDRR
jgi:transglutaminase-like putative cysteine protease